ncbi:MAG: hypothetical protein IT440_11145 [Phycisphaeraceae bacterium]|nr:hypothetical protein [Phycisphaeraceae bacterium]
MNLAATFLAMSIFQAMGDMWIPLLGLIMILFAVLRLRARKRPTQQITAQEQLERLKQARGVRGDLEQVMVEVEELSRRFSAQLDAKAMQLEKLIAEADQRIARLSQLPAGTPTNMVFTSAPAAPPPESEDPLTRRVHQLADAGLTSDQIAAETKEHIGKIELILALRRVR